MPVSDVIKRRAIPLTITRPTSVDLQYGFATRQDVVVAGITGHMQPMSDKELRYVPEGLNTQEWWNIWSQGALQVGDQVSDGSAPTVTVQKLKFWREGLFYHTQGTVVDDQTALPLTGVFSSDFSADFQ